jgi:cytochrome c biogenesis protein ResB
MVIGLTICFCFAHRRIWLLIAPHRQGTRITVGGHSNKQRPVFERRFKELVGLIEQDGSLSAHSKRRPKG